MMKYAVLLLALLSINTVFAQKTGMDKAYKEACDCIEAVSKKKLKEEEKKAEGMDCLQRVMLDNFDALAKDNGYTLSEVTPEVGRQIGEKFGQNLVSKCPASIPFFMTVAQDDAGKNGVPPTAQYIGKGSSKGTFLRLDTSGESPKVILKAEDGTEESFLWIRPFTGADNFETNYKTLINKKITIEWGEFRKYVFSMKAYAKVREITALTVN